MIERWTNAGGFEVVENVIFDHLGQRSNRLLFSFTQKNCVSTVGRIV
jgi:hypothetical protein